MPLLKKMVGIDKIWFIRVKIDRYNYAICFQCNSHIFGEICPWEIKRKCDRIIKLHKGLTYKSNYAYVTKKVYNSAKCNSGDSKI